MSDEALIMMITTVTLVTGITAYFFIRILRTPARHPESDSYSDNDPE